MSPLRVETWENFIKTEVELACRTNCKDKIKVLRLHWCCSLSSEEGELKVSQFTSGPRNVQCENGRPLTDSIIPVHYPNHSTPGVRGNIKLLS
jgi:hypothetical protein